MQEATWRCTAAVAAVHLEHCRSPWRGLAHVNNANTPFVCLFVLFLSFPSTNAMKLFPYGHATHPQWPMAAALVLTQLRAQKIGRAHV